MEQKTLTQKFSKINAAANLWEKTKDPKYKDLWYRLIKEWSRGTNNNERQSVSTDTSNNEDVRRNRVSYKD